jgi:LysM repeat protein
MLNIIRDAFKSSFFAIVLVMLVLGFLIGYTTGKMTPTQSQTANAQEYPVAKKTEQSTSSKIITIKKGDTLWGIATKYFPNQPTEQVIHYLKKINRLNNDGIKVGETLKLS